MNPLTRGWIGHLLAVAAGALITLSLAPFTIWPLGLVSLGLLVWLLDPLTPAQAALRGWCYGLGLFGAGTSWVYVSIHVYGHATVPLAVFLTALFSAGLALFTAVTWYGYARWIRDCPTGNTVGFAAVFTLGEWWRGWFLTGFPWLYVGYGHLESPLAGWAPVFGIHGLSFIIAFSAAVLTRQVINRAMQPRMIVAVLAFWVGGLLLTFVHWVHPTARPDLRVAMVQADISQEQKWRPDQFQPTLDLYRRMSAPLWGHNDIVIWPEAAIPGLYQRVKPFLDNMSRQAKAANATLITGVPFYDDSTPSPRFYNSIVALGTGHGIYHKRRLVPFGEYVPLEHWLRGLIRFFNLPMSSFSPGPAHQQGLYSGDLLLAPFICYEIVYPDLVARWLPAANLLVNISNDAWFGTSIGPLQHLQMAQMRALENGRYLLRSTGSGVSAIIDQRGRIVVRGTQFSREVIEGKAKVMSGETPFSATGSWPILVLCAALCIGLRVFAAKMRG